ncbi:MAG: T9SS type A sorting domain-containing protein, partial [Bacteroidia bacterium]
SVVNTTDSLRANWTNSGDPNSGVAKYWYSIGTSPGATNTRTWTSNWAATAVTAHTLSLTQNTIYYFNVKAENGAGMFSPVTSSNGQKVDTTTIITGMNTLADKIGLEVYPNPFNNVINFKLYNANNSKITVSIIDMLGREISSVELKEESGLVNNSINPGVNLGNGTYLLKVTIDEKVYYRKLVKE